MQSDHTYPGSFLSAFFQAAVGLWQVVTTGLTPSPALTMSALGGFSGRGSALAMAMGCCSGTAALCLSAALAQTALLCARVLSRTGEPGPSGKHRMNVQGSRKLQKSKPKDGHFLLQSCMRRSWHFLGNISHSLQVLRATAVPSHNSLFPGYP